MPPLQDPDLNARLRELLEELNGRVMRRYGKSVGSSLRRSSARLYDRCQTYASSTPSGARLA
jgi:hypothetical protein